jgi:hypothetical protein
MLSKYSWQKLTRFAIDAAIYMLLLVELAKLLMGALRR